MTPSQILKTVSEHFKVSEGDIKKRSTKRTASEFRLPRGIYYKLCDDAGIRVEYTAFHVGRVATEVTNTLQAISRTLAINPQLKQDYELLKEKIKPFEPETVGEYYHQQRKAA